MRKAIITIVKVLKKDHHMYKRSLFTLIWIALLTCSLSAQENWDLERCIRHAQQNSLSIKQAEINVANAKLTEKGAKLSRLPNLNASTSAGYQFGRTINPTTNSFDNISIGSNGISLNAGMTLFNGNRINNQIKQGRLDVAAQKASSEDIANTLALNVAAAYLNILFAEEQLENAKKRLELSKEQLGQTDKLIQAGSLPENDRLQILAQQATDEQAVVTQENSVAIAYLNMKNLLQLEPNYDMQVDRPEVIIPVDDPSQFQLSDVYGRALTTQPIIRAGELLLQSAQMDISIAKSGMIPSLNIFGNIRTDYNSKAIDQNKVITDNVQTIWTDPAPVRIDGIDSEISEQRLTGFEFEKRNYFGQLSDNFGQSVGVSINIPIYNNGQNQIAVERARLGIISTEISNEQNKQQLKADIQRAIADAQAAKKALEASQRSNDALLASYENAQKRFQLGAINTFELTSSKNQLDQAQVDLIIAKYDYLYKLKIVDFYQGKKLSLK